MWDLMKIPRTVHVYVVNPLWQTINSSTVLVLIVVILSMVGLQVGKGGGRVAEAENAIFTFTHIQHFGV